MSVTASSTTPVAARTTATYVFAVRRCGGPDVHVPGHPGGGPVRLLPFGALVAVVQDVPVTEFGSGAAPHAPATDEVPEPWARVHRTVVTAATEGAPTVPLPPATMYANDVRARAALEEHEEHFGTELHAAADCAGWAAKVERDALGPAPTTPH